jgi:hypothetical protein
MKTFNLIFVLGIVLLTAYSNSTTKEIPDQKLLISDDSVDFMLCTPEALYPTNEMVLIQKQIFFAWSSCTEASIYELQISTGSDFANSIKIETKDSTYALDLSQTPYSHFFWKVRIVDNNSKYSFWTTTQSFNFGAEQQIILQRGCNGNCGNCKNPCGRRPSPTSF